MIFLFFYIDQKPKIEYISNMKGSLSIRYDGLNFVKQAATNSKIYWECVLRKKLKCKARIHQEIVSGLFKVPVHLQHNH